MIYKWKNSSSYPITAQEAGEELLQIEREEGYIKPEKVVERSRIETAPLHKCFEWNDSIAGEEYRKVQAREIIRRIEIVREEDNSEPVSIRAFWSTQDAPKEEGGNRKTYAYRGIETVINNDDYREYAFTQALRELEAFERKYRYLTEFDGILREVEKLKQQAFVIA